VVQPELQALSLASQESASWYVLEGGQRLCLFRAEASHGLRHSNLPGSQFPLDNSAISKVLRHWGLNESLPEEDAELLSTRQAHAIPTPLRLRCLSSAFTTSWLRR
jgi:DNA-binding IclR family transcriptional regulator